MAGPAGPVGGPAQGPSTPGQGPGWGAPGTGGNPLGLGPGGLESPYTLGSKESVDDPGAWQLWWEFNKDPYLITSHIHTGSNETLGGDFFLGKGETVHKVGGRMSSGMVQERVVPTLLEAIQDGPSYQFSESVMLAMAKIGGEENRRRFDYVLSWFLSAENADAEMRRVAPIAIGLLGSPGSYDVLAALARDDEEGRTAFGGEPVDDQMRAFAAYGLGLLGQNGSLELRQKVVADLVKLLEDEDAESNELKVAAMLAMGLVPLDVVPDVVVCYCGECKVSDPETSLQAQVTYLLRYFTADREFDPTVRAHTATTLGRLIESQPSGMTLRLKEVVAEFLIESLGKHRRQPGTVKQSAVLALGLMGDADEDAIDQWIRWALNRSAGHGDPLEKRFALISLAMVGSRSGSGDEPWSGTDSVRQDLARHLSRGKKDVKPWAGLALGVLGHRLSANGIDRDAGVDAALRRAIQSSRTAESLGAYALAAGLRSDPDSVSGLVEKLEKSRDETARSYVALALGMIGSRVAIDPLQEALARADDEPQLAARAGLALGLLGDTGIVPALLDRLETTESDTMRASTIRALGRIGDERSVAVLGGLALSGDEPVEIREAAALALGLASDQRDTPWRASFANGTNYLALSAVLTSPEETGVLDMN